MENFNKPSTSIKNWAQDDRPREKLIQKGINSLSNSELLAILINNGSKDKSAVDLAKEVLKLGQDNLVELGKLSVKALQQVKGIGTAKAVTIAAALELGRRRHAAVTLEKPVVTSSKETALYLTTLLKDYGHEVFAVLFLNKAQKITHFEIISTGGIDHTVVDPRIILKKAIEQESSYLVLSHNHPSGSLKPSRADEMITTKLNAAANFMDIKILDHIIVSQEGYYSFADEGLL
jgi:DNA repair protein RadC